MEVAVPDLVTDLLPGDCLLYKPTGLFGALIRLKTWHAISHVEIYAGQGKSWASRDGLGVDLYPYREEQFAAALRPAQGSFNYQQAEAWAQTKVGTPYGWAQLLLFIGLPIHGSGLFCSEFATQFYRAGGLDPFAGEDAQAVAPFEFLICPLFTHLVPRLRA